MAKGDKGESRKNLVSRREFLLGGGAIIATVALAACTPKTTTLTTPTGTSTLTPKYGGVLRLIVESVPGIVGWPAEIGFGYPSYQFCLESLLRGDTKGNVNPWLAKSYKVADDLKSVTFTLMEGVKFHDGSDFNAQVAKWNLDKIIEAKKVPDWASVDIIDDHTIQVNFAAGWGNNLLIKFADSNYSMMVSKVAFDKNGIDWMRKNPVGTGPFKFESFQPTVSFKAARNTDYWKKDTQGNQLPYLDKVECIAVSDPTTQKIAMQAGEGDIVTVNLGKDSADVAALGLIIKSGIMPPYYLYPDSANADSPWANKNFREAVEYAIDREAIAKAFGYSYLQAPYQIPARNSVAYDPNFTLGRKYDADKAKQLLTDAGYSNGVETTIICAPLSLNKDITVAMQSYLSKVGIQAKMEYPEFSKYISYNIGETWHNAALFEPVQAIANYNETLSFLFKSGMHQSWLRTPEMTQALKATLSSPTPDIKLMHVLTDMLTRDAYMIPVYETGRCWAVQPYVMDAGLMETSTAEFWKSEQAWLNK